MLFDEKPNDLILFVLFQSGFLRNLKIIYSQITRSVFGSVNIENSNEFFNMSREIKILRLTLLSYTQLLFVNVVYVWLVFDTFVRTSNKNTSNKSFRQNNTPTTCTYTLVTKGSVIKSVAVFSLQKLLLEQPQA